MRMKPYASGAPGMGTGARVLPGRFTATGRRVGTLIRQRYAPMSSICFTIQRAKRLHYAEFGIRAISIPEANRPGILFGDRFCVANLFAETLRWRDSAVKIEKLSKLKSTPRLRRELFASENPRRRNARNQP